MTRSAAVGALVVATVALGTGCAKKLPPPRWEGVARDRVITARRLAVVAGRYSPQVSNCMIGITKAMIEAFHLDRRYQVRPYRDLLVKLAGPDVDATPNASTMDAALAARLGEKLAVDAIAVVSMSRCGAETGDAMAIGLFAAGDGARLGGYEASRPGVGGQGAYYAATSYDAMARETVDALGRSLSEPPSQP